MKNVFYRKSGTEKACTRAAICNPKRIYSEFLTDYTSGMTEDDKDDLYLFFRPSTQFGWVCVNLIIVFLCYTMYKINHMNLIIVFLYWKQKKSEIYEKWKFSKTVGNMKRQKFKVLEKWNNQFRISDSKIVGNIKPRKFETTRIC